MKKRGSVLWLSIVLAGAPALAVAEDSAVGSNKADDALEERIETRLKNRSLGHVDVDVDNGVATLKGEVASATDKARAAKFATMKGVTRVDNQLEIDADRAKDRVEARAKAQKDRIDDQAERQKEAIDRKTDLAKDRIDKGEITGTTATGTTPAPTAAERAAAADRAANRPAANRPGHNDVVDPLVTTKVKAKLLADDLVKATDINVDTTNDGVVTLRGTVGSEVARARAYEIAKGTEGVRKVVDELKVGPAR